MFTNFTHFTFHFQFPSLKKLCELKGHEHEIESLSSHPSKQQVQCNYNLLIITALDSTLAIILYIHNSS